MLALALLAAACATPAQRSSSPSASSQPSPSAAASAAVTATPAAAVSLSACPASVALGDATVLAKAGTDPDDVVVTAGGDIWLSDHDGGRLYELSAAGAVLATVADTSGPEGIVQLPDGRLLVAQQAPDRVDLFDPARQTFTPWLQLQPRAGVDGVDGIGIIGSTVLVPDSARGQLLTVTLNSDGSAGARSVVASSLGRPVDAVDAGDSGYFVVLENQPGLVHVQPDGSVRGIGAFSSLDDVVTRHGLVYAADLGDHSLVAIDPASGASRTLVSGSQSAQGLALLPDGRLLLADSTARSLVTVASCG